MKLDNDISQDQIQEQIAELEELIEVYKEYGQYHQRFHAENEIVRLKRMLTKHKWKKGTYEKKEGNRYLTRTDVCQLCGCQRHMVKSYRKGGIIDEFISTYTRSREVFPSDNMPACWGDLKPD